MELFVFCVCVSTCAQVFFIYFFVRMCIFMRESVLCVSSFCVHTEECMICVLIPSNECVYVCIFTYLYTS